MGTFYVGHLPSGSYEVFKSKTEPTQITHGDIYTHVIGPFSTKRGAIFMASPAARNNPHVQSVYDAERIARKLAQ